jgi:hypothetical protein
MEILQERLGIKAAVRVHVLTLQILFQLRVRRTDIGPVIVPHVGVTAPTAHAPFTAAVRSYRTYSIICV